MSDGIELHVDIVGDGPPILWLPGGPGLSNYLHPVAQAFPDFSNIVPDPRGTGRSKGQPHSLAVAIQDLEDLRQTLGFDRWAVLGHSWGADLALAYGLAHGETVTSIISFAGTGVQNDRDWHAAYATRLSEEPHGAYQQSPDVQRQLIEDWRSFIKNADLLARIAALQIPITFLHSANDIRPGWPAQQLAYLVPHGSYLELAHAPHEAWLTHYDALVHASGEILRAAERKPTRGTLRRCAAC